MDFEKLFENKYKDFKATFRETSFDPRNDKYLCNSEKEKNLFNFDKIVKIKFPKKQPSSVDSILIKNKKIYCIEFKNSTAKKIKNDNIRKKHHNSADILTQICNENKIDKTKYEFIYCVVFKPYKIQSKRFSNRASKYKNKIRKQKEQKSAVTSNILFGLENENNEFYQEVITKNVNEFARYYVKYKNK